MVAIALLSKLLKALKLLNPLNPLNPATIDPESGGVARSFAEFMYFASPRPTSIGSIADVSGGNKVFA